MFLVYLKQKANHISGRKVYKASYIMKEKSTNVLDNDVKIAIMNVYSASYMIKIAVNSIHHKKVFLSRVHKVTSCSSILAASRHFRHSLI